MIWCYWTILTWIVWPWDPELGVKDILGGILNLPSLSVSENACGVLFTLIYVIITYFQNLEVKDPDYIP